MPTLILALLLGATFALGGIITWLAARITGRRGRGRRIARYTLYAWLAALPPALMVVLPLLAAWLVSEASTRPDERSLATLPSDFGADFETVRFPSRDPEISIEGWWLPGLPGKPPVVFGHGLFRSRQEVLERCCALNREGFPCLVFDFRSHGLSGSGPITLGFRERLDFLGAAAFARERTGAERIVAGGVSMGAVAALMAAAEDPGQVAGICADSPFVSLDSTAARHTWLFLRLPSFPFARLFSWNLGRLGGFNSSELDLARAAPALKGVPVLLIYGREDSRMPPSTAEEIRLLLNAPHDALHFIEGAGHGGAFQRAPEAYLGHFRDWYERIAEPAREDLVAGAGSR